MNQAPGSSAAAEWLSAKTAMRLLDVKPQTLYAYVSRGHIRSVDAGTRSRARLYLREDVERVRTRASARAGHAAVAAAALRWGEPVLDTRIGTVQDRGPIYRGVSAVELAARGATFEEVCNLLWGSAESSAKTSATPLTLGTDASALMKLLPRGARPFDAMLLAAGAIAATRKANDSPRNLLCRIVAAAALPRGLAAYKKALAQPTIARSFLVGIKGPPEALVNKALILCADHELNVSTFAIRVVASTNASLAASVLAGMAALSGPRHGGATAAVEDLVTEIGRPECAAAVIAGYRERGEAVPGFGHPLYPNGDPRASLLLEESTKLVRRAPKEIRILHAAAAAMSEHPTLDVGLVAVASILNLPRGSALAIFASGRLAGWLAHALEQRAEGHLLRPRARYIGV